MKKQYTVFKLDTQRENSSEDNYYVLGEWQMSFETLEKAEQYLYGFANDLLADYTIITTYAKV